jgi:hemin uptake protein HemP
MRERIHTIPGAVEGLVPMGAALPTNATELYALSAAPQYDLSSRLKDALRHKEPVVGIEHKGRRYTVKCTRIPSGELKADVERAFRAKQPNQTVLGLEQGEKGYRVEITPLGVKVGGRRRGRPRGSTRVKRE